MIDGPKMNNGATIVRGADGYGHPVMPDPFASPEPLLKFLRATPERVFPRSTGDGCALTLYLREVTGNPEVRATQPEWDKIIPWWAQQVYLGDWDSGWEQDYPDTFLNAAFRVEAYLAAHPL